MQVARCTKIINADSEDSKYIINVKQFAKFVVDLAEQVASTDIEEGMRVGVDRNKYQVCIQLIGYQVVTKSSSLNSLYSPLCHQIKVPLNRKGRGWRLERPIIFLIR